MVQQRSAPRLEVWLLVTVLFLRTVLGFAYSLATPAGEAPDEADHYAYAAYLLQEGQLPVGPEMTQGKHPPLYHMAAALAGQLAGGSADRSFLRANPDMAFGPDSPAANFFVHTALEAWPWHAGVLTLRVGRLVSVLAGLGLVLVTYLLGRTLWPKQPALAVGAAALAAFLPESLFIGGAMSNDMLAAMWSALAMLGAATLVRPAEHPPARPLRVALLTGLCLGLAFVTKASTGSLAVVIVAAVLLHAFQQAGWRWPGVARLAPIVLRLAVIGVVAFLVAAPWLWRNWRLYGDPFGWPLVLATIDRRPGPLGPADVVQLLRGWWLSFWGKFGGAGHIPLPVGFYLAWAALSLTAVGGWVRRLLDGARSDALAGPGVGGWALLLGGPLVTALSIYSYSQTALGTDQGRLLFPALAPLALLLYYGVAAWAPARGQGRASRLFAAAMVLVATGALIWGLLPPYAPPPEPAAADVRSGAPVGTRIGPFALISVARSPVRPGQLTLYWQAVETTADDLRTDLRVLDSGGALLWEWKRSPGAGRFSTDRWPRNRIVADTYRIPPDMLERSAAVQVGLRPFPEGPWLPISGLPAGQLLTLPP